MQRLSYKDNNEGSRRLRIKWLIFLDISINIAKTKKNYNYENNKTIKKSFYTNT